jgi:hypothetical protein
MIVLGIDPGPDGYHMLDGATKEQLRFADCCGAWASQEVTAIIEWPEAQGRQIRLEPLLATRGRAQSLADKLHEQGVAVYIPSRAVIMRQLGYSPRRDGGGDSWLRRYLVGLGHKCGRGTALNSSHARAALAASMFNYRDPRNAKYLYRG